MIVAAAEIDGLRGRNMDTHTPQEQCASSPEARGRGGSDG
jgi:hypothetical protein